MRSVRERRRGFLGTPVAMLTVALVLAAGAGVGLQGAAAQDGAEGERHPAHIHSGTCEQLGDVVRPLSDVGYGTGAGTPAAGEAVGAETAVPVETSVTTVDLPLEEIVASEHAINVHESAENIDEYIACGDIGGQMTDEMLVIGLRALNGSGYAGVAVLEEEDDSTTVSVYLLEAAGRGGVGTAKGRQGTPATGAESGAEAVTVEIRDFAYSPDPVVVPVGGTVTWTYRDTAPHTATAEDRDVLQSGTLNQGESYSQTFDEADTYEYFCEFHSNMKGAIVVK